MLDFYRGRRVFITGHTGFKGSWLAQILLLAGAEVTGFALKPPTEPNLFTQLELSKQLTDIRGDVRDLDSLSQAMAAAQPEVIFHLAAQPLVLESYRDPVTTYATNVMGTVNLLAAARQLTSVRSIVNVTTDKVYENREQQAAYREDDRLDGFDPYSNSKSCSELVTATFRRSFYETDRVAVSTARAGNVIGGGDYSRDRLVPDCGRAAAAHRPLLIRHARAVRPYQHVLDCLSGYLLLASQQARQSELAGAYNFGPDETNCLTSLAVVELFARKWGTDFRYEILAETGPHEATLLKLNHDKATKQLGWTPHWDMETALTKVIAYLRCPTPAEQQACIRGQISEFFGEGRS